MLIVLFPTLVHPQTVTATKIFFFNIHLNLSTPGNAMWWHKAGPLQWLHNESDGVSNHQLHESFLKCLFRRRSKETSKLRAIGLCDRWIPRTKGQLCGKYFHLMTSSWSIKACFNYHNIFENYTCRLTAWYSQERVHPCGVEAGMFREKYRREVGTTFASLIWVWCQLHVGGKTWSILCLLMHWPLV